MLTSPLDPERSLQLNKYWPGEKYEFIELIRDLENSLNEFGFFKSRALINKCADLLPEVVRRKFRFLLAQRDCLKQIMGSHFMSL